MVHKLTVKQSLKRYQMWQIKGEGHEIYPLTDMRMVLFKMISHLGGDTEDNKTVYLLSFSEEPFDGYLIEMEKVGTHADSWGTACEYRVTGTREIDYFMSDPILPSALKMLLKQWPEKLYLSLKITKNAILLPHR